MIRLDDKADTFPDGLKGTPFETVYKALRKVAADVWAVDPTVYRAGMGWGWSALQTPEDLEKFREIVINALISAFAPLIKDNQTNAELVEYLRQWREYTPTFPRLQALYSLFGVSADIQPISDPESQSVIPVTDTMHAFYVCITPTDESRLLTLFEAYKIAVGASPLGSRPYVYYALESDIDAAASPVPMDEASTVFVANDEIATEPEPPEPPIVEAPDYYILDDTTGAVLHSINSPLSSAKPSAVTITGNIEHIDNPPAEYIDVILAMKYNTSTGQFVANASSANDWWWSCVRNQEDKDRLTAFGVRVEDPRSSGSGISTGFCGPYGCVNDSASNPAFRYEVIGVYSDIDGTTPISQDVSNFYTGRSPSWPKVILIWNIASTPLYMTWKCRITKNY